MDERDWLSPHETGADPITNMIEPDLPLEIKPDRHSATGRPLVDLSSYITTHMRWQREFDAARARLCKQAARNPRMDAQVDPGSTDISGSCDEPANVSLPRYVCVADFEHSRDVMLRQSTPDIHAIQLATFVAAMREQGFRGRSLDRVKQGAARMLDAFRADGGEPPLPRAFVPQAVSTRTWQAKQRRARLQQREVERALALPAIPER
ncbi:hypothetical protein [Burkholderia sp. MSMB1078WGS]|uniref:hypothetical protein n=1 Tax=Burkholderia sp. MSMB1078WGS TaxID=1637900 RepID=UPI000B02763E|nr:hypothetical protein [Burkholderia sp. MSMB1078WGS]